MLTASEVDAQIADLSIQLVVAEDLAQLIRGRLHDLKRQRDDLVPEPRRPDAVQ